MTRDGKKLGPDIVRSPKTRKPFRTTAQDRRHHGNGFHIVHSRRATIKPGPRRKRRLHARHAFLAFKALQQRGFFTTEIGSGTVMQV